MTSLGWSLNTGYTVFNFSKPFSRQQILDSANLKEFADNNFKSDEKFSKQVENAVGKREIAHREQFLFFPQFSKGMNECCFMANQQLSSFSVHVSVLEDDKSGIRKLNKV